MPNFQKDDIAYPDEEKAKQDINLAPPRRLETYASKEDPETQGTPTWGDYGKAAQSGAYDLAGYVNAGARLAGEEFGLDKLAKDSKDAQEIWHQASEDTRKTMSEAARARMEATLSDPDFYGHMMSSIGLKGAQMAPSIVASVIPATIMSGAIAGTAAAAATGAAINTGAFVDQVQTAIDNTPTEDLAKQSPPFAKILAANNGDEIKSRQQYNNVIMGLKPLYVFGASFLAETLGPGAAIARRMSGSVGNVAGKTGWRAIIAGGAEGGGSNAVQQTAATVGTEQAAVDTGAQKEIDAGNVAEQATTALFLGTALGGAIGMVGGHGRGEPVKRQPYGTFEPGVTPGTPSVGTEAGARVLGVLTDKKPLTDQTPVPHDVTAIPAVKPTDTATAKPSTALPDPKIAQATEHPEVIRPGQPRRKPLPKAVTPEGNALPVVGVGANPDAVTATPATGFEKVDGSGMDSAIATALKADAPVAPPATVEAPIQPQTQGQPRPRLQSDPGVQTPTTPNETVGGAPAQPAAPVEAAPIQPPGTVQTSMGLATEPRPIEPPPPARRLAGERGSPATDASPPPETGVTARAPDQSAPFAKGPRILEDTRPEVVAQNRLITFQEKERLLQNQRGIAASEKATSGEPEGRPLYGKAKAKAEGDAAIAKGLFDEHVPESDTIPTKPAQKAALKSRLDTVMAGAKEAGLRVPTNINYEGANPTADHMVWLREVADLRKNMDGEKGATQKQITQFLIRERAAKKGDFGLMKSERRSEGDIAKRGQQADVETMPDTTKLLADKEKAQGVAEEVTSKAHADAEPVRTVASATKRGGVRFGEESQGAASEGKKVEVSKISPEEKARIIAASNRVVAEAGKEAPKPAQRPVKGSVKETELTLPPKVTPKVSEKVKLSKKIAAAAKEVDPNPTPAQIEAGNYAKGHVSVQGIPVTIETPSGVPRRGVSEGRRWESKMPAGTHYGEIKSTRGTDGDKVDVFLGPHPDSDFVLVMDQVDPSTKEFDEHKTFVGYRNVREATEAYVKAFDSQGPERIGGLTPMTIKEFKEWLGGDTTKPVDDMAVAREARDEAGMSPDVELDDNDIRSNGPVIPYSNGVRSIESIGAVDALNRFAKPENTASLPGKLYPLLKRALIRALDDTDVKVHFVTDANFKKLGGSDGAIAFYDSHGSEQVIVRQGLYKAPDTHQAHAVMHELAHAATVGMLNAESYAGTSKNPNSLTYHLTDLLLDIKKQVAQRGEDFQDMWSTVTYDKIYGLKNIRELIAEAMSNDRFQDLLGKINVSSDVAARLDLGTHQKVSFWKAIVTKIREHLGMPKDTYTALEAALSLSERALYSSRDFGMELNYDRSLKETKSAPISLANPLRRSVDERLARPDAVTAQHLQDNLEGNLKEFIDKRKESVRRSVGDPKILRLRSLTDMAALAKDYFRGNSVRRVVNAIEAIRVTGGEIAKRADPIIHALISAERKYRGTEAFNNLTSIMHDATMSGVHPDRTLAENTHLGKKSMAGFWGRQQHPQLKARYDALPADLKKVYQDSRKLFEDLHNQNIKQSLENRVLKALGYNDPGLADRIFNDKVTDADKATLGDDYELVAEAMDFKKQDGPYFPLKRFGNNVVRGTYKIPEPSSPHRVIDANTFEFDTQKAAEAYVANSQLHADLDSVYVDDATGSRYFLDEKGKEVPVLSQDTDAVKRWRVRIQDKHLEFFENRAEAEARRQELVDAGVRMEPVVPRRNDPRVAHGDMLSTHMDRLMHRIEGRDTFKEMTDFQQNEVRRAVEEASYGVLSSTRIQTSRMQRRYVEGASRDIVRSTAEYSGSMAGYLSRYEHQAELDSALREMNKEADGLTSEGNNPQTAHGRGQIRNEIMYRLNQPNIAASGSANRTFDQIMHRLKVTSFIGHLGSPAYSLFNATQPTMVTTPILAGRHGLGSSVAAMVKAYSDVGAVKGIAQGIVNTARRAGDQLAETNTYVGDLMSRITNPGEKAMMNHLIKHGAIDADAGMEISKLVDRNRGDQWLSYFEGISRQLPLAVESINRGVSALAAYRLEMKRTGGDHEASTLYAQEIVESTQGIYANTNMPPVFSANPIASLTFQFKKYGHMIYSLLGQQIGKAIRNANPGDRAEAIKALGFIAGAHIAMAGTVGLPTEPIKMILIGAKLLGLTGLTMDDFDEWQREQYAKVIGKTGAEMLTHGITRGLPGGLAMETSNRMGMQDFLTFGEPSSNSSGDIYSFVGETLLGAPGGSIVGMTQGASKIANGDIVKGMEQMVPVKLIADGLKAYQLMTEGKLSKSGRQVAAPLSLPEATMRLLGIQPARIAEQQQAAQSFYRNTGRETAQRSAFMDQYALAKGADRGKVWRKIQEWNKTLPVDSRLTMSHLTDYVRNRGKETPANTLGGIKITKQNKAIAERTKELYSN